MPDPAVLTAWLVLLVAMFTIVGMTVGAIAFLWKYFARPQIERMVEGRVSVLEQATSASIRRVHDRIDVIAVKP